MFHSSSLLVDRRFEAVIGLETRSVRGRLIHSFSRTGNPKATRLGSYEIKGSKVGNTHNALVCHFLEEKK